MKFVSLRRSYNRVEVPLFFSYSAPCLSDISATRGAHRKKLVPFFPSCTWDLLQAHFRSLPVADCRRLRLSAEQGYSRTGNELYSFVDLHRSTANRKQIPPRPSFSCCFQEREPNPSRADIDSAASFNASERVSKKTLDIWCWDFFISSQTN